MRESVAVAAELTGVPIRTIRRWIGEGRITAHWRHGKLLVAPIEVLQLSDIRHAGRLPRLRGSA